MTVSFPKRSPGVLMTPTADGAVVYDLVSETLHTLNAPAAQVLKACGTQPDRAATLAGWADDAGIGIEQITTDVDAVAETFRSLGLIDGSEPRPLVPAVAPPSSLTPGDHWCTVYAGNQQIRIRSSDRALVESIAATLDRPIATDDPKSSGEPTSEFVISRIDHGRVRLRTDTEWIFDDATTLARDIVNVVNDYVARSTDTVVLHAAVLVSPAGEIVVFPATSGAGKSTLAGLLIQQGWTYAGDESVAIDPTSLDLLTWTKPLTLDASSKLVLGLSNLAREHLPARLVSAKAKMTSGRIGMPTRFVIPHYSATTQQSTEQLDATDALVALTSSALNLRYVGEPGLAAIVHLACTKPVHRMTYSSSHEALNALASVMAKPASARTT